MSYTRVTYDENGQEISRETISEVEEPINVDQLKVYETSVVHNPPWPDVEVKEEPKS